MSQQRATYKEAGVDIEAGNRFVDMIKPLVKSTMRPEVLTDIGGFGGLCGLPNKYKEPVLVSGTDGVGTKLKLAFLADIHDTVGIDLVAMCVNDIIVQGAEPLFFLDYLATGKLEPETAAKVVAGIAEGCRQAGCALIGGETAEMPGFYQAGEYDIAGFTVGVVEKSRIIDGSKVRPGDRLIALASSGLHSNGYSLARRLVFDRMELTVACTFPGTDKTVGEVLLTPTKIYVKSILSLLEKQTVHGIAHITGGGLLENVPRVLPEDCAAVFDVSSLATPHLFSTLQAAGDVERDEMYRTFNMGIGMVLAVPAEQAEAAVAHLQSVGEEAWIAGSIIACEHGAPRVVLS